YDAKSSAPFSSTVALARSFSRCRAPGSRHNNPDEAARRVCFRASVDVHGQHSDPAMTSFCHGNLPPNPQSTPKPTRNWPDHAEVHGLRAPVKESCDVTQELIRRRQVQKAPNLALFLKRLPHLPIPVGCLRMSFVLKSERGLCSLRMDRDHRIVVLGVAKAGQF